MAQEFPPPLSIDKDLLSLNQKVIERNLTSLVMMQFEVRYLIEVYHLYINFVFFLYRVVGSRLRG